MNVVLFSNEYPPFVFGGVGTFVKDLAFGLNRLGLRVTVLTGYPVPRLGMKGVLSDSSQEIKAGIKVVRFPYPNIPPRHTGFQLLNLRGLSRTIAEIEADIVHGQCGSTFPALLAFRNIAPIIMTYHGSLETQRNLSYLSVTRGGSFRDIFTYGLGYPMWNYSFKKEYQSSSTAVAVSKTLMEQLISEMNWVNEGKMRYVHNGVDIEMIDRVVSTTAVEKDELDNTIVFGGRLFWGKGVLNLLSLASILQHTYHLDLKIVIYGSGPLYKQIKKRILENSLRNVVLRDFVGRTQFLQAVKNSTFVVVPSFYEASPMFLLESMCMGKVPLLFDLPYAREFTQEGRYGVLAKNVHDMASKINQIYRQGNMELLEKEIKDFARARYDIRRTASEYYDLYREICERAR